MGHAANAEPSSIAAARAAHTELYEGVLSFFGEYDMLVTPTVILPPYDMDLRYPSRLGKVQLGNYLDWMVLSWALTVTQCPAMSVPVGFTSLATGSAPLTASPSSEVGVLVSSLPSREFSSRASASVS